MIPVFSSLALDESIVNYLTKNGVYAMSMGDDTMEVVNAERLQERPLGTV